MKHKTAFITSIILTGGILAAITSSIAWFDHKTTLTPAILQGSTQGAYFGGGNGTVDTPYLIKNQRHLYNLAWLQYLGEFNKTDTDPSTIDKQYYFKRDDSLKDSGLDRKDFVLPPIGTESNPFLGNFDGNEVTINNITVSNNFNDLNKHPYNVTSDSFNKENIQIVGFFGIIGSHNTLSYSYSSVINSVSNLYLNNVTINTSSKNTLCGIFAGYANASISYCGVHYATIKIGSHVTKIDAFNNVSSYTLIGDYNQDGYEWEDKPGGDVGYGTSTDIRSLYNNLISLNLKDDNTGKLLSPTPSKSISGNAVPIHSSSNILSTEAYKEKSLEVTNLYTQQKKTLGIPNSNYVAASSKGDNIGYYVGELKVYDYSKKNIDYTNIPAHNLSEVKTVDSKISQYLSETGNNGKRNGDFLVRFSAKNDPFELGSSASGLTYVSDAWVGKWHSTENVRTVKNRNGCLLLPTDCIWVAPIAKGRFDFVVVNPDKKELARGFIVCKLKREVPGDYSTPFVSAEPVTKYLGHLKDMPLFYFGVEVSDLNYEYAIFSPAQVGGYVAYIDIGANGGGSTTDKGSISKLDFVTADANEKLTKLTDPGYTASNSFFSINGTSASEYVYSFRRINDSILYYVSPIGSGFTITELGTGTKKKTDNADCKS